MSARRQIQSLSPIRMGVLERLSIAALGCTLLWAGVIWAIG